MTPPFIEVFNKLNISRELVWDTSLCCLRSSSRKLHFDFELAANLTWTLFIHDISERKHELVPGSIDTKLTDSLPKEHFHECR